MTFETLFAPLLCAITAILGAAIQYAYGNEDGFGVVARRAKDIFEAHRLAVVLCFSATLVSFILGLAIGNVMGAAGDIKPSEWQGFAAAIVAMVAASIAFASTWQTQRVSVLIKEQERIEKMLPDLRTLVTKLKAISSDLVTCINHIDVLKQVIFTEFAPDGGAFTDERFKELFPTADFSNSVALKNTIYMLLLYARVLDTNKGKGTKVSVVILQRHVRQMAALTEAAIDKERRLSRRQESIESALNRYFMEK